MKQSWGRSRRVSKATILYEALEAEVGKLHIIFWGWKFSSYSLAAVRISKFTVGNYFGAGQLQLRLQRCKTFDVLFVFLPSSLFLQQRVPLSCMMFAC